MALLPEPFHFIHMGPMSDDATVLRRLCVADFGHVMWSVWQCHLAKVWQFPARAKPNPRLHIAASTPDMALLPEPFQFIHMGQMSDDARVLRRLCVAYFGHVMSMYDMAAGSVQLILDME
jgi:hypothetical protein